MQPVFSSRTVQKFSQKVLEDLYISGLALIIGIIIVVPLGVLLTRFPKLPRL